MSNSESSQPSQSFPASQHLLPYPFAHYGNHNADPDAYSSNTSLLQLSKLSDKHQKVDQIECPRTLVCVTEDVGKHFTSVRVELSNCQLSNKMKPLKDQFFKNVESLYETIQSVVEAQRITVEAITEVLDNYGPNQDADPEQIIDQARDNLRKAQNMLLANSKELLGSVERMQMTNKERPNPIKRLGNGIINYNIHEVGGGVVIPIVEAVTHVVEEYIVTHFVGESDPSAKKLRQAVTALALGACTFQFGRFVSWLCPDAASYKSQNLEATGKRVDKVEEEMLRMMDGLGKLRLYWKNMQKETLTASSEREDLERVVGTLRQHMIACRRLANEIQRSAEIPVSGDFDPLAIIEQEQEQGPSQVANNLSVALPYDLHPPNLETAAYARLCAKLQQAPVTAAA